MIVHKEVYYAMSSLAPSNATSNTDPVHNREYALPGDCYNHILIIDL